VIYVTKLDNLSCECCAFFCNLDVS